MDREEYCGWTNYHTWRYGLETGLYDHEDREITRTIRSLNGDKAYDVVQSVREIIERNGTEMFESTLDELVEMPTSTYMRSLAMAGINDARKDINWWELAATMVSGSDAWEATPADRAWLDAARKDARTTVEA
jgi:hypothetical protein